MATLAPREIMVRAIRGDADIMVSIRSAANSRVWCLTSSDDSMGIPQRQLVNCVYWQCQLLTLLIDDGRVRSYGQASQNSAIQGFSGNQRGPFPDGLIDIEQIPLHIGPLHQRQRMVVHEQTEMPGI